MRLLELIELIEYADSKPAGEHGEFEITVQKTGATPPFIAHGVHKQNSKQQRKAGGKTQDEAIRALKDLIDKEYKYSDTVASSKPLVYFLLIHTLAAHFMQKLTKISRALC